MSISMDIATDVRRGIALVASAATLLGLSLVGVQSAQAADRTVPGLDASDGSIAINGKVGGHKFAALRVGIYQNATVNDADKITSVSLATDAGIKSDAEQALRVAKNPTDPNDSSANPGSGYEGNPVAEVASKWLGFSGADTSSNSKVAAWSGKLREFVTALAHQSAFKTAITTSTTTVEGDASADSVSFKNLPEGLYVIEDVTAGRSDSTGNSTRSIPMLVGTNIGAYTSFSGEGPSLGAVNLKNDEPSIAKKVVSSNSGSATVGDYIGYEIDGEVPLTTGYTNYTYRIKDIPTKGLSFVNKDSTADTHGYTIKIGSTVITNVTPTVVDNGDGTSSTVFDFSSIIKQQTYGDKIVITYFMQVNDDAKAGKLGNKATLTYSDDHNKDNKKPNGDTDSTNTVDTGGDTGDTAVYFYNFNLAKRAKADPTKGLAGAKFSVTKSGATSPLHFNLVKDDSGVEVPGSYKVATDQTKGITDLAVDSAGNLKVDGLGLGTYEVTETVAPEGFSDMTKPSFSVTFTSGSTDGKPDAGLTAITNSKDSWGLVDGSSTAKPWTDPGTITVYNVNSVAQLPLTGGAGIILAVLVALVLAGTAGVLIVVRSRSNKIMVK